jgi:hypothetical protein
VSILLLLAMKVERPEPQFSSPTGIVLAATVIAVI